MFKTKNEIIEKNNEFIELEKALKKNMIYQE